MPPPRGAVVTVAEIQSLYIVNMLVGITLAACLAFVAGRRDRELGLWALAFALYPLGFLFFGLRGQIPDLLSIAGGNGTLALMFALFTEGLCRLHRLRVSRLLIWGPPPFAVLGFVLLQDDLAARVVHGAITSSYHAVLIAFVVTCGLRRNRGSGSWIIFVAIMTSSLVFLVRAVSLFAGWSSGLDFLTPGLAQTVYFSLGMMCLIMFAIGLLVTYKERAEAEALRLAQHDPLTQLANRRVLQERLQQALERSRRSGLHGALLVLDLDLFKQLNDAHGHAMGDQLLIEVAYRLKDAVTQDDTVVRLGGDEFVLLIEALEADEALARSRARSIAHRVQEALTVPYPLETLDARGLAHRLQHTLTVSIGVSVFLGERLSREALFRQADAALYKAKHAGRNAVELHET